jgi:hypothetical protein
MGPKGHLGVLQWQAQDVPQPPAALSPPDDEEVLSEDEDAAGAASDDAAAAVAPVAVLAAPPEPPRKSVTYQPEPLSWKPGAVSCFVNDSAPQAGQAVNGASEIFCRTSLAWPQDAHL